MKIERISLVPTAAKYPLPQRWQILQKKFLKLLIGSQPIIERISLICGNRDKHSINPDNASNFLCKNLPPLGVKGILPQRSMVPLMRKNILTSGYNIRRFTFQNISF